MNKYSHSQCTFLTGTNKLKFPRQTTQPCKQRQTRHCGALRATCRLEKILVANRGEIAVRVIRTAHELGIPCVAVYSTIDKDALHVKLADESVCIGEAPSNQSYVLTNLFTSVPNPCTISHFCYNFFFSLCRYLVIPNVLAAATSRQCTMLHPGYGFLAEHAVFVDMCRDHGINFIGPNVSGLNSASCTILPLFGLFLATTLV